MSTTAQSEIVRQSEGEALRVLVLGNDPSTAKVAQTVEELGFGAKLTDDPQEVLGQVGAQPDCVVLCDAELPPLGGPDFIAEAQRLNPSTQVILIAESYNAEAAIEAIQSGAYDYLPQFVPRPRLKASLDALAERLQRRARIQDVERQLAVALDFHGMLGCSAAMLEVFDEAQKIARHFKSLLLLGPAGAGKELLAHAIHEMSPCAGQKFVVCHCSASAGAPLEHELFGTLRTGQSNQLNGQKAGLLEHARGGTIFLDDIGRMPLAAQAKLLQVAADLGSRRASEPSERRPDVRIIAATTGDLRAEVLAGRFREDLFCLMSKTQIRVPALIERREDIPLLAQFFLGRYGRAYHKRMHVISRAAMSALVRYEWPGNVGELESVVSAAVLADARGLIDLRDLPEPLRKPPENRPNQGNWQPLPLREVRREHIEKVLDFCHGNRVRASQLLGIGRTSLYRYLKRRSRGRATAEIQAA